MSLLTAPPVTFGSLVAAENMIGHFLVVGWLDDRHRYAICEKADGFVISAKVEMLRVARPARSWKDRPRGQHASH